MHQYLRAIGFSKMNKKELHDLLDEAMEYPDSYEETVDTNGDNVAEIRITVGSGMGISFIGNYDKREMFHVEHYEPYLIGERRTGEDAIGLVRLSASEQYQGIYDNKNFGVEIIFSVNNVMEILRSIRRYGVYKREDNPNHRELIGNHVKGLSLKSGVAFSALALDGKIIMPMYKTRKQLSDERVLQQKKSKLMEAAKEGDVDAIQELSVNEFNAYHHAMHRTEKEDILSIVTTYFIPSGLESDQYDMMGEILSFWKKENILTMENVWILRVNCNDIVIDVAVNEKDLIGIPAVGRRFKGHVWLQGQLMQI